MEPKRGVGMSYPLHVLLLTALLHLLLFSDVRIVSHEATMGEDNRVYRFDGY